MRAWAVLLVIGFAIALAYLVVTRHGPNDYAGRPLGTDFSTSMPPACLLSHGDATAPPDILRQQQQERALFGQATPIYGWHYPPFFLLIAAALAELLIFPPWSGNWPRCFYLGAIRLLLRKSAAPMLAQDKLWPCWRWVSRPSLSISPMARTVFSPPRCSRQAWRCWTLLLAGLLFGLLAYKPQFAVVLPLVLVKSRDDGDTWRSSRNGGGAGDRSDRDIRLRHLDGVPGFDPLHPCGDPEQGSTGFPKIQRLSWVRLWGGPVALAYAVQTIIAAAVALALIWLWRSKARRS